MLRKATHTLKRYSASVFSVAQRGMPCCGSRPTSLNNRLKAITPLWASLYHSLHLAPRLARTDKLRIWGGMGGALSQCYWWLDIHPSSSEDGKANSASAATDLSTISKGSIRFKIQECKAYKSILRGLNIVPLKGIQSIKTCMA